MFVVISSVLSSRYYVLTDLFRSFFVSKKIFERKGHSEMAHTLYENVAYEVLWVCLCEIYVSRGDAKSF